MAKYGPKPKVGYFADHEFPPWDCFKCGKHLTAANYYRGKGYSYGLWKQCKKCVAEKHKAYREDIGPDHWRELKWLSNFNLTAQRFQELFTAQGERCAICGADEPGARGRHWSIDHDHACCPQSGRSCGKCVRGILCANCNLMLGHAKDNADTLMSALDYLRKGIVGGGD